MGFLRGRSNRHFRNRQKPNCSLPWPTIAAQQARYIQGITNAPLILIDVEALTNDPGIVVDEEVD